MNPLETPQALVRLWPKYEPTPLIDLPRLAARCRLAKVMIKDEGRRLYGSFKVLGGMYAGLRALTRAARLSDMATLVAQRPHDSLPALICASDGNHGLAVAAGAQLAGAPARVYLHSSVPQARARRIAARGAEIVWVPGTYDDAVREAAAAAARGEGLLISDTTDQEDDAVVADVLAGYGLMAQEVVDQLRAMGDERPTHLFVQAGVGGLAAALAEGVRGQMGGDRRVVVVEPDQAACVGPALKAGRVQRIPGDLKTVAEMLSCGEASVPALKILLRHAAMAITVSEAALADAVRTLASHDGPATTPSGAAGLAGLLTALPGSPLAREVGIDENSRVLLVASEGPVPTGDEAWPPNAPTSK
jgi:diaminopropionate ammonia-lyase